MKKTLCFAAALIAALWETAGTPPASWPDKEYVTEWIRIVYPDACPDENTAYIIDGMFYRDSQADSVLTAVRARGRRLSFVDFIPASKIHENLYVNRGEHSGVVIVTTFPDSKKEIKKTLKRAREEKPEIVRVGIVEMTGQAAREFVKRLETGDIYGIHLLELPPHTSAGRGDYGGKTLVVWMK